MRSSKDPIDFQEGRSEIPSFQVDRGDKMRLSESLENSKISSDHQGVMAEEDQRSVPIIVKIREFLPTSLAETRICVAGATSER
jgi:hypothetical protein